VRHNQGVSDTLALQPIAPGRPPVTSHAEIEQVAFRLFTSQGFLATTTEQIAAEVGIGRRTLFRYFPSKNDIPWGRFDESLDAFHRHLTSMSHKVPLTEAIVQAVVEFNTFPAEALDQHRVRMELIVNTPDLQAHATLKYAQWRAAISNFVAQRTRTSVSSLGPVTAGHAALAMAMSAYEIWLREPSRPLPGLIREAGAHMTAIW
jgi:mycofactocin system transcriptional regulator